MIKYYKNNSIDRKVILEENKSSGESIWWLDVFWTNTNLDMLQIGLLQFQGQINNVLNPFPNEKF